MRTSIDRFGRVVLPKKVRDALGLSPGTPLEVDTVDGVIELRLTVEQPVLVERSGVLVFAGTATGDLVRAIEAHRETRNRRAGGMGQP